MKIILLSILVSISIISVALGYYKPTANHNGWRFEISHPFGLREHTYRVVSKKDGHPVRFGEQAERFEVRPGDCGVTENGHHSDCATDRERSEMDSQLYQKFYDGDEYWYRWSIFFPRDYDALHPVHMTFGQFKQIGCHPVFSFNIKDYATYSEPSFIKYMTNRYAREVEGAGLYTHITRNFRDKWFDIVVHAKWSHSNNGKFQFWVNGKLISDYKGKTLWCYDGIYFKYGIYRTGVSAVAAKYRHTIVYYDGIRISKTDEGMFDPLSE